jgi:hypothetical protein
LYVFLKFGMLSEHKSTHPVARYKHVLPSLEILRGVLRLSDQYPSGLEWDYNGNGRKKGEQAGKRYGAETTYRLSFKGEVFSCHRLVYLLRTSEDPGDSDVVHGADNVDKDNRKELYLLSADSTPNEIPVSSRRRRVKHSSKRKIESSAPAVFAPTETDDDFYPGEPCLYPEHHIDRDSLTPRSMRHKEDHYCRECVKKIKENRCGIEVNYIYINYLHACRNLFNLLEINSVNDHWYWHGRRERLVAPSYRSTADKPTDNVAVRKLIYAFAWGDVGTVRVNSFCGDPHCMNPLHLESKFNRFAYPRNIEPLCVERDPKKLLQSFYVSPLDLALERYKKTIEHPLEVPEELPDYHEDE